MCSYIHSYHIYKDIWNLLVMKTVNCKHKAKIDQATYNINLLKQNITTDHTPHVSIIIFKAQWCEWRSVLTIPYIYAINIFLPWMLRFKLTSNLFQVNGSIHHINTSVSSNFNAFSWTLRVITLANILSYTWHLMWNDVKHLASCIQNNQLSFVAMWQQ